MKFNDFLKAAIIGIKTNKTRSFLTVLGIIIGVASVILVRSLGEGAQNLILRQIISMGSNNVYVMPGAFSGKIEAGKIERGNVAQVMEAEKIKTLTLKDIEAIEKDPLVEMAAPLVHGTDRVVYGNNNEKVTFFGTTSAYNKIIDAQTILGSNFTDFDVRGMSKVAVLGYQIKKDLFGDENPIGKIIRIKQTNFRVIGVMEERGMQMFQNPDKYIYVPITTAQKFLLGINYVQSSVIKIVNQSKIDEAIESIRLMLRERHNIYNPEDDLSKDDFTIISGKEAARTINTVTNIFKLLLSSVAAVSLIVGGVGVMNVMLVSVTERTREIGLRKAVGACRKDILYQFLVESVVLTISGGILGILLGAFLSYLMSIVLTTILGMKWNFVLSLNSIIIAFGVTTIIGLVFGIYPARKAAKLSPIDALRYE